MAPANPEIVSASDVAAWAFCPESLRLTEQGHVPTNTRSLARGDTPHEELKQVEQVSSRALALGAVLLVLAAILLALGIIGVLLR